MKKSICGEADCPTPYEFCEACIRADERVKALFTASTVHRDEWAELRAEVEALPCHTDDPLVNDAVERADVLALLDGEASQ